MPEQSKQLSILTVPRKEHANNSGYDGCPRTGYRHARCWGETVNGRGKYANLASVRSNNYGAPYLKLVFETLSGARTMSQSFALSMERAGVRRLFKVSAFFLDILPRLTAESTPLSMYARPFSRFPCKRRRGDRARQILPCLDWKNIRSCAHETCIIFLFKYPLFEQVIASCSENHHINKLSSREMLEGSLGWDGAVSTEHLLRMCQISTVQMTSKTKSPYYEERNVSFVRR